MFIKITPREEMCEIIKYVIKTQNLGLIRCFYFSLEYRNVKHQEVLWNYSLERLGDFVTDDLLTDLKVDLEELGVVKKKK